MLLWYEFIQKEHVEEWDIDWTLQNILNDGN